MSKSYIVYVDSRDDLAVTSADSHDLESFAYSYPADTVAIAGAFRTYDEAWIFARWINQQAATS